MQHMVRKEGADMARDAKDMSLLARAADDVDISIIITR